jgi:hypothetical protein
MGKGMGFLQQSAEGLMILLISIGYGVYIGLGLLSCIVALGTWVSKTIYACCNAVADHRDPLQSEAGVSDEPAVVMSLVGFAMMVVGGVALAAIWRKTWFWLFVIEIIMLSLLVLTVVVMIAAFALALGIKDPVLEGVDKSWMDTRKCA